MERVAAHISERTQIGTICDLYYERLIPEGRQRTRFITKADPIIVCFPKDLRYAHIYAFGNHRYDH